MSDSVSKYYDDKVDKEYWEAKDKESQNKSRFSIMMSFISNVFKRF